jgi:uncharacterized protein YcbK (DUF882 family)
MRASRIAIPLSVAAIGLSHGAMIAAAASALADTSAHPKHCGTPPAPTTTLRGKTAEVAHTAVASAAAAAYLDGKQALVGLHAPSTRPVARDSTGRPMLSLSNVNRGEGLDLPTVSDDGGFAAGDLDRVAHLLRAGGGEEHPIDPRTLGLVYRIQRHFDVAEIRVVSGYRIPKAGSRSNHGKGRAVDLIVPGVADEDVARFARDFGFVGVGVYPVSQFVHVDIRPRSYFWVDVSGPHMRNRERSILGDLAARSDNAALARGDRPIEPFLVSTDVDAALRARAAASTSVTADDDEDDD